MIGPLFESYDSTHLERLINILIESGIKVKSDAKAYRFRRGLGLVQGVIGFGNSENSIYLGFGHPFNPFLWFFDGRLLKKIEEILLSNGAKKIDSDTEQPG